MNEEAIHSRRRRRLEQLRDRYLAVTLRSRTIRLFRTTRSGALDLHRLATLRPAALDLFVERLGTDSDEPIPLVPIQPTSDLESRFAADLGLIARHAREVWMETGARELAVGWPFLEGRCADGTWLRGPLFLYPVTIATTASGRVLWTVRFDGVPDANTPLLQVLGRLEGACIRHEDFLERDDDGLFKIDAATWLGMLEVLQDKGLSLEATSARLPEIAPLPPRTREERDATLRGTFLLSNHLILGRFPRWGSTVVGDYESILEGTLNEAELGLAAELLLLDEKQDWHDESGREKTSDSEDETSRPADFRRWQVLPSDASQDSVFRFLERSGPRGLVVQGPPGTGKSQLITNLVGSAIGAGRTLLLVCQKRAALDVVADRLRSLALVEPIALVHDVERARNAVCASIAASLECIMGRGADSSEPASELEAASHRHEQAQFRLNSRLSAALRAFRFLTVSQDGRPPMAALQERALQDDGRKLPDLEHLAGKVSLEAAYEALPGLESACVQTHAFASPHPLAVRRRWHALEAEDVRGRLERLEATLVTLEAASKVTGTMLPADAIALEATWAACQTMLDLVASGPEEEQSRLRFFWVWTEGDLAHGEWRRVMDRLEQAYAARRQVPPDLVLADRASIEEEVRGQERLQGLNSRWYRIFMPEWWSLRGRPAALCRRTGIPGDQAVDLATLRDTCLEALAWMDLIADLPIDLPFMDVGVQGDPAELTRLIRKLEARHDMVQAVHTLFGALSSRGGPYAQWPRFTDLETTLRDQPFFASALADRRVAALARQFATQLEPLRDLFEPEWLQQLEENFLDGDFAPVREALTALRNARDDAERLCHMDRQLSALPDWAWWFLKNWQARSPGSSEGVTQDALLALDRAWRKLLLEGQHPLTREAPVVDPHQLKRLDVQLEEMTSVAAEGVLACYRRRLASLTSSREQGRALRQLYAEARKRRRRMSLRQLVEGFWNVGLAKVRPVWFCSPESVASLFPLARGMFDLVVFDEASQCPVESAIPTLVRAKAAVIAGDDQQMPPSHFFRASIDDPLEDEEDTLLASHSILSLGRIGYQSTTLRWHYRSRHESLVAFSNAAFYQDRLITAPSARRADSLVDGLHWERVDGLWQDQINKKEASQVIVLLKRLLRPGEEGGVPSIGVVTFNRKQAELIESLMDLEADRDPDFQADLARDRARDAIEQCFVRNLENVQGDERDVIIFSIGYAPATPGGRVMARFGPLGQAEGEKRLNVAITRARRGIWVLASFEPSDLDVSKAKHLGPRLLELYLEFVRTMSTRAASADALLDRVREQARGDSRAERTLVHGRRASRRIGRKVLAQLERSLRAQGLEVVREMGLGTDRLDLAVRLPGTTGWRVGVDCTGFLATRDNLARDVYIPRFWRRMEWEVMRVSPAMWLEQRDEVVERITEACRAPTGAT